MRNLALAGLCLFVCFSSACSDPARVARREVDRMSRALIKADAGTKRVTREALTRVAVEEGMLRGAAMKAAGCPSASTTQPDSAPVACKTIAAESQARYSARTAKITVAADKVDKSIGALWATLLLVLDIAEDVDGGWGEAKTLTAKLAKVLNEAIKAYADAMTAYQEFRDLYGSLIGGGK